MLRTSLTKIESKVFEFVFEIQKWKYCDLNSTTRVKIDYKFFFQSISHIISILFYKYALINT